jgi:hypothetical protein
MSSAWVSNAPAPVANHLYELSRRELELYPQGGRDRRHWAALAARRSDISGA